MGAFVITDSDEAIGWSAWPWDQLYTPVVGAFVAGRLVSTASCHLSRPHIGSGSSLFARARRRVLARLGLEWGAGAKVDLEGPEDSVWFRMSLPAEAADRLRGGDSSVRLERLEDGRGLRLRLVDSLEAVCRGDEPRLISVEALLDSADSASPSPLDGFSAFLTYPPLYQLQTVFFEYLRRLPEPEACAVYVPSLQSGALSVLQLRDLVLASEEFGRRRVGYGARLGSTLVSAAWRDLLGVPFFGPPRRPLQRFRVADYEDLSTTDFIAAASSALLDSHTSKQPAREHVAFCEARGRRAFALHLSRSAARRGAFLEIE